MRAFEKSQHTTQVADTQNSSSGALQNAEINQYEWKTWEWFPCFARDVCAFFPCGLCGFFVLSYFSFYVKA